MAILGSWSVGCILDRRAGAFLFAGIALISLVLIVASEARTAGFAFVFAGSLSLLMAPWISGQRLPYALSRARSSRLLLLAATAAVGVALAWPIIDDRLSSYILKRSEAAGVAGAYEASRGGGIQKMWHNFKQHPLVGTGFGIEPNPDRMTVAREPFLGLPISAPVEKGVLPLAILEETGVTGFIAVAGWLLVMWRRALNRGVLSVLVLLTALLMNLGECTLFSPGGFGLLPLILLGWAVTRRKC